MVRIAIVEDDPFSREKLHGYVRRYCEDKQIPFLVTLFPDGKEIAGDYKPVYDIIFMDIEMEGLDGMQAARQIRKVDQHTVIMFVTKMVQYAVKGYEVDALDFMVKPVDYHSFAFKMRRALERLEVRKEIRLVLRDGASWRLLLSSEIYYIEVLTHNLHYHTTHGVIRARGTLSEAEQKLGVAGFKRCNKSYLLNLVHVTAIDGNDILIGGERIPLSRSMRKEVLCAMADYYGGNL